MSAGLIQGSATQGRLNTGTFVLPISTILFPIGITQVGNRFVVEHVDDYYVTISLRPSANTAYSRFTFQLFNVTTASVAASHSAVAPTVSAGENYSFTLPLSVTSVTDEYEFRIVIENTETPKAFFLIARQFEALIQSASAASNGLNPVVVDLGTLGASFAPTVSKATDVIVAEVDANFAMDNLTISGGAPDKFIIRVELTQGAVGGDVSMWNAANFVGSDLVPLTSVGLSVGVGKTDILIFEWDDARGLWMLVGFFNGVAP